MSDVLVMGGGICGLATAMMLARDGHEVLVIEKDPDEPPDSLDEAFETWDRPGVNQFRLAHYTHARFRHVLDENLPDVRDRLIAGGGLRFDILNKMMPSTIEDRSAREGDDRYWTLTARRPVLEGAFAQAAAHERGVRFRRGTQITGLIAGAEVIGGVPHIVGARTADGEELRADVVVDAMGRKSQLMEWIPALGGRAPFEHAEDCGFAYYGRNFRSRDGKLPEIVGPLLTALGTVSVLTLPGDNDTWMVVAAGVSRDMPLKNLRFEDKWTRVIGAMPWIAHWLDGEPFGDFKSMSGIMDRYRRFVVDGVPVATGLFPVADAWACTNPSLGRGISLGMWHAARLRDLLHSPDGDPAAVAAEWDAITEAELTPWYQAQVDMDRARVAEINAIREGREPPGAEDPAAKMQQAFFTASQHDPDLFRAFLEVMGCLSTPEEILSRPGVFEKMLAAAEGREPVTVPGPNRAELLELVA
jgi:2-polyprenyl-6-methoxyphenol hydroxylase-like FAD-dependent oxidoreductase